MLLQGVRISHLACLGFAFWSLVDADDQCNNGNPLPAETDCSLGGCCASVAAGAGNSWIDKLRSRTGMPADLINQIAHAYPVSEDLDIDNLRSFPESASLISGQPQQLFLQLKIIRITAIDQKKQNYVMQYVIKWTWRDCRLAFNCSNVLPVSEDSVEFVKLWRPRYQIMEKEKDENDHLPRMRHSIQGYGVDTLEEVHASVMHCPFDFKDMPFDEQTCKLSFFLPGWPAHLMKLAWAPSLAVTSNTLTNAEWEITQGDGWITSAADVTKPPISLLSKEQVTVSELYVEFKLKRKSGFLVQQFALPALLFYILSYLGLWLNTAAVPARVACAVIPALAVSNKTSALASILPPISATTRLSGFLDLTSFLIVLHLIEYGVVHLAERRVKALADSTKRAETANQDVEHQQPVRIKTLPVWKFLSEQLEIVMRGLSPLIYIVAGLVMLYA